MNIEYLLLCAAVLDAALAAGMLYSEFGQQRPGWRAWALSCGLRSLGLLVYMVPMVLHRADLLLPAQLVAVGLAFASAAVTMLGTARFLGARPMRWLDFAPLLLLLAGALLSWAVWGDARWRGAFLSLGLAYGFAWSCLRTLLPRRDLERERRFLAATLGLWALLLAARAFVVIKLPLAPAMALVLYSSTPPWFFIGYVVLSVATVIALLSLRNRQLLNELDRARTEALRRADADTLTGLLSRTATLERARLLFADALASDRPVWALMLDCDHFKRINDRYGHLVGDTALRALGDVIRQHAPPASLAGRFGGEEFLIVMAGSTDASPMPLAEMLRRAVHDIRLDSGRRGGSLTVSIGVAVRGPGDRGLLDLVRRADEALLLAKSSGRDRVVLGEVAQAGPESAEMAYRHSDFSAP